MNIFIGYFTLAIYLISLFSLGLNVTKRWFTRMPMLLDFVGSLMVGIGIGVPITYALAILVKQTGEPILWSTILFIGISIVAGYLIKIKKSTSKVRVTLSDMSIVLFAVLFSSWLMIKTFRSGAEEILFVGSNNVFDFGNALGIVRSFSWGNNIPFMSPFRAGLPLFYHFFFYFFVAIWEHFGVPIVWAMNVPSILSFASLIVMVYFLPQILLKQTKFVGWIAVLLTITHSTLTFWYLLIQKGISLSFISYFWRIPTYPFAGPFDGSVISIFMTLNNYVNQRHLAFAVALGLFLIMTLMRSLEEKRITTGRVVMMGLITGSLFLWNMTICASVWVILALLLGFTKRWKEIIILSLPIITIVIISCSPFFFLFKDVLSLVSGTVTSNESGGLAQSQNWSVPAYFWENLGILPLVVVIGLIVIPKKFKIYVLPFVLLFLIECVYAGIVSHGFDQKFLSFFIIGINIVVAYAIGWLWQGKKYSSKVLAICVSFVLMVSGVVDLMVIKNEFAFPLVNDDIASVISWIGQNTRKKAVFVSYSDIIDPVVLAGRNNYFGFYGNIGSYDRSNTVQQIYKGDNNSINANNISFLLIPKWQKNDFPYTVDVKLLTTKYATVYEDTKYLILRTNPK